MSGALSVLPLYVFMACEMENLPLYENHLQIADFIILLRMLN
jgi:hypothetical protein